MSSQEGNTDQFLFPECQLLALHCQGVQHPKHPQELLPVLALGQFLPTMQEVAAVQENPVIAWRGKARRNGKGGEEDEEERVGAEEEG